RNSVNVTKEQHQISNYGKICFYNGFLYISESEVGIHIIDNTEPSRPRIVGFIELVGNADLAVRDNVLYADALIDLVWFDISDPENPKLKGRLENAFPDALPVIDNPYGYDYSMLYTEDGSKKGVVVGWTLKERIEKVDAEKNSWGVGETAFATAETSNRGSSNTGVNGSMSRFSLYKDYLYAVINYQMTIFDLKTQTPTKVLENFGIGNVETIFNYKDKMFLGMPTGMAIYSVEDPINPTYCSTVWHVLGCDPVVVDNDLAYVTVRSGNFCGQTINQLTITDVQDVYHPRVIVEYTMKNPKGLGIDDNALFLCDDGLKVFKTGNPQTLIADQIAHYPGMDGFDVIPYDHVLMMIADNGLYQYDYSDIKNIKQLSVIPITQK
ncbi:MAG: hypothetical protein FWF53_08420, partial [Candidatus Azobacteroides sp.]|nr:hypothetical protein [Candidatus Azobacteroides sp.]